MTYEEKKRLAYTYRYVMAMLSRCVCYVSQLPEGDSIRDKVLQELEHIKYMMKGWATDDQ